MTVGPEEVASMAPVGEPRDDAVDTLAKRFASGEEAALQDTYERYGPAVLHLATSTSPGHRRAEQVTRDTFVAAWTDRESYDAAHGTLLGWLLAIAGSKLDLAEAPTASRVIEQLLIADELAELRPMRRWVLELALVDHLTYQQIARVTGTSVAAVQQNVSAGMMSLRRRLEMDRAAYRR